MNFSFFKNLYDHNLIEGDSNETSLSVDAKLKQVGGQYIEAHVHVYLNH
jgi:hypothetical protein